MLLAFICSDAVPAAPDAPEIGAGARFEATELGPGWRYGFFNRTRTEPPCYVVIAFGPRASPDQPLRIQHIIPVARLARLQTTEAPEYSMLKWDGLTPKRPPEASWKEMILEPLMPQPGECIFP